MLTGEKTNNLAMGSVPQKAKVVEQVRRGPRECRLEGGVQEREAGLSQ
jgi:hypothetical protein